MGVLFIPDLLLIISRAVEGFFIFKNTITPTSATSATITITTVQFRDGVSVEEVLHVPTQHHPPEETLFSPSQLSSDKHTFPPNSVQDFLELIGIDV